MATGVSTSNETGMSRLLATLADTNRTGVDYRPLVAYLTSCVNESLDHFTNPVDASSDADAGPDFRRASDAMLALEHTMSLMIQELDEHRWSSPESVPFQNDNAFSELLDRVAQDDAKGRSIVRNFKQSVERPPANFLR